MLQMCRWNSSHFSGYLYISRSWFHLKYTFITLHSVPSCAKSDHLTFISLGYLVAVSGQLVPKSTRTWVNSYPSQLVPKSTRTLFETWILWVSLLLNTFIYSSLLPSTSAASCQWKRKSFQTQMRRGITQRLISVIDVILKKRQLLFKLW